MDEKPKRTWRRWFQWRLSTWLVLVGIIAWGMACRPYIVSERRKVSQPRFEAALRNNARAILPRLRTAISRNAVNSIGFRPLPRGFIMEIDDRFPSGIPFRFYIENRKPNPSLYWPALALIAFVGWKALWLIRERCAARTAHPALK